MGRALTLSSTLLGPDMQPWFQCVRNSSMTKDMVGMHKPWALGVDLALAQ